jgi:biopolymer transport protein ExbB
MGSIGQIISFLIFGLSVLAVFIFVERLIATHGYMSYPKSFMDKLSALVSGSEINQAREMCLQASSPSSRIIAKGLNRIGSSPKDIQMSMENQLNLEIFDLERGQQMLSMISKLAPMLGFIGTIAGVIQIFYTINATGEYNIESISGGLYVKMITSALGLFLGIMAYVFYFVVSGRINKSIYVLEKALIEFLDIISE